MKGMAIRVGFFGVCAVVAVTLSVKLYSKRLNRHLTPKLYSDQSWSRLANIRVPGFDAGKYNVILDHHSHTNHSDGIFTVRQNIEWHRSMGFNVVFITDHNTDSHVAEVDSVKEEYRKKGVVVLSGMEWTTSRIHLNFLGIKRWDKKIPRRPTDEDIRAPSWSSTTSRSPSDTTR